MGSDGATEQLLRQGDRQRGLLLDDDVPSNVDHEPEMATPPADPKARPPPRVTAGNVRGDSGRLLPGHQGHPTIPAAKRYRTAITAPLRRALFGLSGKSPERLLYFCHRRAVPLRKRRQCLEIEVVELGGVAGEYDAQLVLAHLGVETEVFTGVRTPLP